MPGDRGGGRESKGSSLKLKNPGVEKKNKQKAKAETGLPTATLPPPPLGEGANLDAGVALISRQFGTPPRYGIPPRWHPTRAWIGVQTATATGSYSGRGTRETCAQCYYGAYARAIACTTQHTHNTTHHNTHTHTSSHARARTHAHVHTGRTQVERLGEARGRRQALRRPPWAGRDPPMQHARHTRRHAAASGEAGLQQFLSTTRRQRTCMLRPRKMAVAPRMPRVASWRRRRIRASRLLHARVHAVACIAPLHAASSMQVLLHRRLRIARCALHAA
jgi:hypothetical protein